MIINASNGYDTLFLGVSESPQAENLYSLVSFSKSDGISASLAKEWIKEQYAEDLLQNDKNADCLRGGPDECDLFNTDAESWNIEYVFEGWEEIFDAICSVDWAGDFMQKLFSTFPFALNDMIEYIREAKDEAMDKYLAEKYNLNDGTLDSVYMEKLITEECSDNVVNLCKLYKKIVLGKN